MFKFRMPKEGKGVSKDAPKKKPFFRFFEIYFTHIGKMTSASMLYSIFALLPLMGIFTALFSGHIWGWLLCLPIVFIGPATAGLAQIMRNFAKGMPVFVLDDFRQGFTENLKPALKLSLITLAGLILLPFPLWYYIMCFAETEQWLFLLPISVLFSATMLFVFAHYYLHLFMVTMELDFKALLKNSVIMAISELRTNFMILFFQLLILVPLILFFPVFYFPVLGLIMFVFGFSLAGFMVAFPAYRALARRLMLDVVTEEPVVEEEERIFSDQLIIKENEEQ